jgi:hypothetical protein
MVTLIATIVIMIILVMLTIRGVIAETNPIGRCLLYLDVFVCALVLGDADMTISVMCSTPSSPTTVSTRSRMTSRGHAVPSIAS